MTVALSWSIDSADGSCVVAVSSGPWLLLDKQYKNGLRITMLLMGEAKILDIVDRIIILS